MKHDANVGDYLATCDWCLKKFLSQNMTTLKIKLGSGKRSRTKLLCVCLSCNEKAQIKPKIG